LRYLSRLGLILNYHINMKNFFSNFKLVLKKCYSSFSTILKTVNHILDGQLLYYSALLKTEYVKFENSLVNESYDELIKQSMN